MIVEIVVERGRLRSWMTQLRDLLESSDGVSVRYRLLDDGQKAPLPLKMLLWVEKFILGAEAQRGIELRPQPESSDLAPTSEPPSFTIDLTHSAIKGRRVQVLYNGSAGEDALVNALTTTGTPLIQIVEPNEGLVLAEGTASLEAASGVGSAMAAVYSRVAMLLEKAINGAGSNLPLKHSSLPKGDGLPVSRAAKLAAKTLLRAPIQSIYNLLFYPGHWHVGWRLIEETGVFENRSLSGAPWQILKSPHDHFYADPFPFTKDGKTYLFFEDLPHETGKGVISYAEITPDGEITSATKILEEDWHLSYPFIFEYDGEIWMIPESSTNREVVLHRAVNFPEKWERYATLLKEVEAADATVFEHDGKWWMFAVVRNGTGGYSDVLNIYHSDALTGPWLPHTQNPVLVDDRSARPAGHIIKTADGLWRPVQDCRKGYGAALGLARVDVLTPDNFKQTVEMVLEPNADWPGRKLHTLNRSGQLEAIDGSKFHPRSKWLTALLERRTATSS